MPAVELIATVSPPTVKLFPLASFSETRMVVVLTPSGVTVLGVAEISEVAALAAPGVNEIVPGFVKGEPPIVA